MTTDKLPKVEDEPIKAGSSDSIGPAIHSSAEQAIKNSAIDSESKGGRKISFVPKTKNAKISMIAAGSVGIILVLLLVVMLSGGGTGKLKIGTTPSSKPVEIKDLEPDNNSSGYTQSPTADFGGYSLNLDLNQPEFIKSASFEAKIGEQITWDDGFVILATSIERDYRPSSEFSYKKIAEAGDELVRVNFLVGNAGGTNMTTGYSDLALYASAAGMENTESERISEDTYSPKDGQILGSKQTQKISLHFRVERGKQFSIIKTKSFEQPKAKVKEGQEKKPVLNLKIILVST